jgi:hypothetical protein
MEFSAESNAPSWRVLVSVIFLEKPYTAFKALGSGLHQKNGILALRLLRPERKLLRTGFADLNMIGLGGCG